MTANMIFVIVYWAVLFLGILGLLGLVYFFPSRFGDKPSGAEIFLLIIVWPFSLAAGLTLGTIFGLTYLALRLSAKIDNLLLRVADKGRKDGR